ncbi:MAG: hypothetical protein VX514_08410, partial [Candidatus Thermoplasmatota archaeon]|nr:hypothetical protein [Candidatus Thermoplasmatota archaeon]
APMPPPPAEIPPPPAPSAPMPPPPAEIPPPPAPAAPMPPPPAEIPTPVPAASSHTEVTIPDEPQSIPGRIDLNTFRSSESPSQNTDQMYGHIDRIASGNVGTLLDRFSNRFGSNLDREIIVLRKKEQQAMREVKPTIELISSPGVEEEDTPEEDNTEFSKSELNELKTRIENRIRPLKKRFDDAKSKRKTAEVRKLQPELKQMVEDRKTVIAAIDGDFDSEEIDELLEEYPHEDDIEVQVETESDDDLSDEDNEDFVEFVELANELLGMMPSSFQKSFLAGDSFDFYKQVYSKPADTNEEERTNFVDLINDELSSAPDEVLVRLKQDIDLARRVKERYG